MESCRLKNIAIVILLLLNAGLLLLLGWERLQNMGSETEVARQIHSLYAANQLDLSLQTEKLPKALDALGLSRSLSAEKALAAALLGESSEAIGMGGGIYDYTTKAGLLHFRSGGGFDGTGLHREVEDPEEFVRKLCRDFGYGDIQGEVKEGSGVFTARGYAANVPVEGCGLRLRFRDNVLTEATGTHISLEEAAARGSSSLTGVTALVRFLDYRNTAGVVCGEVREATCIYELQSNPLGLVPLWLITTDSHDYLVDGITGEVSRRQTGRPW